MRKLIFLISFSAVFFLIPASYGETIILKSGRKVEGKITEQTDKYIKVEVGGVNLTYYWDEIEGIDEKIIYTPQDYKNTSGLSNRDAKEIFRTISPAVVYITTLTASGEEYLGSGFVVDSKGIIVTNYHVVQSAKEINVKLKDGQVYPVTDIVYFDTERDLCIFKITADNLTAIPIGNSQELEIGETVYVIGNPLGLEYSFSNGMLSGVRDYQNLKWLQFTAPVSPGNSGGPIINAQGQAIGVVTFLMLEGQNLNFALAINEIKPYISDIPKMSFQKFAGTVSQADNYLIEAQKYLLQGYYNIAIPYIEEALRLDPDNVVAYNNFGYAYHNLGQYDKAVVYLEKAIQMDSNYASAYNNLAGVYESLGQYDKAIRSYEEAIQLKSADPTAYNNLGSLYYFLGQYDKAIFYLEKAIQINPNFADAYGFLGDVYYSLGQHQKARENYQKAKQLFETQGDSKSVQSAEEAINKLPQ